MSDDSLEQYRLNNIPPTVFYIPNFITELEEDYVVKQVYEAPKPKWTELSNRRLQNWGGIPHEKGMIPETIPKWLTVFCDKVTACGIFADSKPNHVLVNEYLSGQGIMPHTDGPLYHPVVANITLKSHGVLDLYHSISKNTENVSQADMESASQQFSTSLEDRHFGSIFLERRSLLLVKDDMYSGYLHGITERTLDTVTDKIVNLNHCPGRALGEVCERETRVSLTIRNIPKVIKAKFMFGKKR